MSREDCIQKALDLLDKARAESADDWDRDTANLIAATALREAAVPLIGELQDAIRAFLRRLDMAHDLHAVFTIKDSKSVRRLRSLLGKDADASENNSVTWNGAEFPSAHAVLRDIVNRIEKCDPSFSGGTHWLDLSQESFAFLAQHGKTIGDEL